MTLEEIGSRAKAVSRTLNNLGSREKNIGLEEAARALLEGEEEILAANQTDYEKAESSGMSKGMLDRLALNPGRIQSMADGLLKVAALDDPVGEVISMKLRPNGLKIGQKRVPFGVIGVKIGEFLAFQLVYRLLQDLLVRLVTQIRDETALLGA